MMFVMESKPVMLKEVPWVRLSEVISCYGMTMDSATNAIRLGRFPVHTYNVGRFRVVDKAVHLAYFQKKRDQGMKALKGGK